MENDGSCQPSAAHPDPVILVHGTLANMDDNWQAASPLLANHGYCVYAFNYGGASASSPIQGTGDIAASRGPARRRSSTRCWPRNRRGQG